MRLVAVTSYLNAWERSPQVHGNDEEPLLFSFCVSIKRQRRERNMLGRRIGDEAGPVVGPSRFEVLLSAGNCQLERISAQWPNRTRRGRKRLQEGCDDQSDVFWSRTYTDLALYLHRIPITYFRKNTSCISAGKISGWCLNIFFPSINYWCDFTRSRLGLLAMRYRSSAQMDTTPFCGLASFFALQISPEKIAIFFSASG